jgi:hypothetical protein
MVFMVSTKNFIGEDVTISAYEDGQEIPVAFLNILDKSRKEEAMLFAAQISGLLNGRETFSMKSDARIFFESHPNGLSLRHQKDGKGMTTATMNIRVNDSLPEDLMAYVREKLRSSDTTEKICRAVTLTTPQAPAPQSGMHI